MAAPTTAAVIGCTGLVGSHILTTLLSGNSTFSAIHTVSRRHPKVPEDTPRLQASLDADTTAWASKLSAAAPTVVFSALGTTRAQAGSIDAQWKIDHDLNVELAKAAKAAGTRTYVFVSSAGTTGLLGSHVPFSRMKRGVEDAVQEAGFENAIVLRPGMLLGQREQGRAVEGVVKAVMNGTSMVLGQWFRDSIGQDADVVARAAVRAAALAQEGKAPSKYWLIDSAEVLRLGRDEWDGGSGGAGAGGATATPVATGEAST